MPLDPLSLAAPVLKIIAALVARGSREPILGFSYGTSGNHDLIRLPYQRPDGPKPAHPWVIYEARVLLPLGAKLYVSDEEAVTRVKKANFRTGFRLKPGGTLFVEWPTTKEWPSGVWLLIKAERGAPAARTTRLVQIPKPIQLQRASAAAT
jgi:hypothetical protein